MNDEDHAIDLQQEAIVLEFSRPIRRFIAAPLFAATSQVPTQQITGTPGSPGATIMIDGTQLPPPMR